MQPLGGGEDLLRTIPWRPFDDLRYHRSRGLLRTVTMASGLRHCDPLVTFDKQSNGRRTAVE